MNISIQEILDARFQSYGEAIARHHHQILHVAVCPRLNLQRGRSLERPMTVLRLRLLYHQGQWQYFNEGEV
jgi:hypothetical protein